MHGMGVKRGQGVDDNSVEVLVKQSGFLCYFVLFCFPGKAVGNHAAHGGGQELRMASKFILHTNSYMSFVVFLYCQTGVARI